MTNDIKNYFVNPETMDMSQFVKEFENLDSKVQKHINLDSARVDSNIAEPYAKLLERENLSQNGENIEDIFERLAEYSQGLIRWTHPGALINVNPPASIPSVVASSYFSLYNPNGAQDMSSGYLMTTELAVVKMICRLAGIDEKKAGGIFTFGGKSTNLHAIKHGLQRINPMYGKEGIKDEIMTFSSKQGHPCHAEVCNWLGIGNKNCTRIPTDNLGVIDVDALRKGIESAIENGKKVACITVNGGTTIQMTVDPIKQIAEMRDEIVTKYKLDYKPRIHVDSVIGWAWLFFRDYDFKNNPLKIGKIALEKIEKQCKKIQEIKYADSFGVDFHKTGFCSYLASLYITLDRDELFQQNGYKGIPYEELEYGNYSPFQYTLELSRSLSGPIAAYVNLKLFGIEGYQRIIGGLMDTSEYLKAELDKNPRFEVINENDSDGFVTLLVVKENENSPSFFEISNLAPEDIEKYGRYIHKFYLYLLEKQKKKECWFTLDYSSGYHILANGKKIGVLKAYPMSPYFDKPSVDRLVKDLSQHPKEFDKVKDIFEVKEVPHKPRPFCYR